MPPAVFLLAVAVFAMGTSEFMLAGLVPDIATGLDVSVGAAGSLTSAFAAGMVVGAPLTALLARRLPVRTALLGFLLAFAAVHAIGALATGLPVLLATRVAAAFANAGFLAVALNAAAALVPADRKGRALSVLLSGTTAATVAGVPGGAALGALLGWRATFWAVAVLCLPAAYGVLRYVRIGQSTTDVRAVRLRGELAQLARPRLALVMLLGALVNAGTFATFNFLAPVVTETAGMDRMWVPAVLMLFGAGSFLGVTIAGRLADRRAGTVLAVAGPLLLLGWLALAVLGSYPVLLPPLVFAQGVLSFALGGTLIARVLYEANGAPTMGGAYATAALNVGAAGGVGLAAAALAAGNAGPVWASAGLVALALCLGLPLVRVVAGGDG